MSSIMSLVCAAALAVVCAPAAMERAVGLEVEVSGNGRLQV
jgi:hypothetical protein